MRSVKELLTEFSEMGSQHYFQMHSGRECEGWIVSVEEDHVLFVDCDPLAGKDEAKVRFGVINISSLAFRDEEQRCWTGVRWNETPGQWVHTVIARDEIPQTKEQAPVRSFWPKLKRQRQDIIAAEVPPAIKRDSSVFSRITGGH